MKKYALIIGIVLTVTVFVIFVVKNLSENKDNIAINYEIITNTNFIAGTKSEKNRGYEIVEKDNEYYLIIYYGEQSSYYSKLEVLNVEIKGTDVKVTVKLPENEGMGDAFSYPKALIKFDKEPKKVNISYK